MKHKPNRKENGEFASRHYVSRRARVEDRNGKLFAYASTAIVCLLLVLGAVQGVNYSIGKAKSFWGGLVSHQIELSDRALDIAYANIPIAHASEPLPYVPDTLRTKEDYQWYLRGLVPDDKLYREMVEVIDCETAGTWNTEIQSEWRYKHGKMKNKQELSFGLSQIHLPAHPGVTRAEATDPKFALAFIAENYPKHPEWWSCSKFI